MKQTILKLLIDCQGHYLSGEEISKRLAVSRTAIWKHVKGLKGEGYVIQSSPRLGYRLIERPDILLAEEIRIGLNTRHMGREILIFERVSSTNDLAKEMASQGAVEGTVVIAEEQSQGRGRMGRPWVSEKGKGIWLSLLIRPQINPAHAPQFTFISANAVCRALQRVTNLPVTVKWPNDIIIKGKKVCGILTELSAEIDMLNFLIIGIGINVSQEREGFLGELEDRAISLHQAGALPFRRITLIQALLQEMEREYTLYMDAGFSQILDNWRQFTSTLGKEVRVITRNGEYSGMAMDVDSSGQLLVKTQDGRVFTVTEGDVSIRPAGRD